MNLHPDSRVLVAGLGNVRGGDDAFGVVAARCLMARTLPAGVRVLDAGISNLRLAGEVVDGQYDTVILIDAVARGEQAGTISVSRLEVPATDQGDFDLHGGRAEQIVAMAQLMGARVAEALLVSCEPARFDDYSALSPPVAGAVEAAADTALWFAAEASEGTAGAGEAATGSYVRKPTQAPRLPPHVASSALLADGESRGPRLLPRPLRR
ncbi:MAG TPA: hydrogenase maturation protease [Gemmatimonadaceae bacterium]